MSRACTTCGETKALDEFHRQRNGLHGRSSKCKVCRAEAKRKFRLEHPDRAKAYHQTPKQRAKRRERQMAKFGITVAEYERMLASQGGVCAICHQPELSHDGRRLAVDHDHVTGAVRSLLCGNCNKGLGNLGDCPDRLRAAARYLERHR